MTGHQKEHITAMRMQGIGYSTIGKSFGLKKETVAAFCRKNGQSGVKAADSRVIPSQTDTCPVCGTVLVQIPGRKKCRFCSETAVGNTVPFPAPPSKGAIPMPESYRERLSAMLCVKRIHSLWLFSAQACTQMVQYSPEAHHNFVQYMPPQRLAICRRVW